MFMQDFDRLATQSMAVSPTAPAGLTAATMIETANGWRRAEALRMGDRIYTMDGGLRPVLGLTRTWLNPGEGSLVHIPGGAFDNCDDLLLPEGQLVLVQTGDDAAFPDALVALAPAVALVGLCGITRRGLSMSMELIQPHFAQEEVIWGNSGVQLFCPAIGRPESITESLDFTVLSIVEARNLLSRRRHDRSALPMAA